MWTSDGGDTHNNGSENTGNSALLILSTEDKSQPNDLLTREEQ